MKVIQKLRLNNKAIILKSFGIAIICLFSILFCFSFMPNTFALSFESEQGLAFTFNPTVSLTVSGDLSINNLSPGDVKDSNIITITASSNTVPGYTLYTNVGNTTYNYRDLRISSNDTTNIFSPLSSTATTTSDIAAGQWGYSYSLDSGSTWINGSVGSTTTGYGALPLYNDNNNHATDIVLADTNTNSTTTLQFKIGAKANTSQLAGTYTNIVNFIGVGKVVTTNYTIDYNDPSQEATNMPSVPPDAQATHSGTDTEGNGAVKISSTIPTRTNYIFKGWCTTQTSDDSCSGDTVQPGGYLALNPGTSNPNPSVTKTLYAMWREDVKVLGYTTNYTGGSIASYEWTGNPPTTTAPTITKIEVPDGMHYHDGSQIRVYTKNAAAVVFWINNAVRYTRSADSGGMAKLNITFQAGTYTAEMIAVEKNVVNDYGYAMATLPYTFTVLPAE